MSVTFGTDTYGRVKRVGGTPIVTKFAMLQCLPIYPLQSFYLAGDCRTESSGVPLIADSQTVAIDGIPLARVDWQSVAMAYVRGIFGAMTVIGFLAIVPLIMHTTGEHLDKFAMTAMRILVKCFVVGVTGGLLTYAIPLTLPRERRIRTYCGEILGISADPARVAAETSVAIEKYTARVASRATAVDSGTALRQQLIVVRSKIAQGIDVKAMELQTDHLLGRLDQLGNHADQQKDARERAERSVDEMSTTASG